MRILLLGEYSHLHNSLKDGLKKLGHDVFLASSGDGFKNFPADFLYRDIFCNHKIVHFFRKTIHRFTKFDIAKLERGFRFWWLSSNFKNFDVVQLINEAPIQTTSFLELWLLKKVFAQNKKVFLLSAGVDFLSLKYMIDNPNNKSILQPYYIDKTLKNHFQYILDYGSKSHKKVHYFVYENCLGIIASDIDYVLPLQGNKKFLELIPNPINTEKIVVEDFIIHDKIIIFLGINQWNAIQKGTKFFEKALAIIQNEFPDKVEIIVAKNIPYSQYINLYNKTHILLDQVYAHDQGYNALEAMAKGKVVFTGAEIEFDSHYDLAEKVVINAKPDVDYLVEELRFLIENPAELLQISENAKAFITKHHNYIDVAKKYLETWNSVK
ncbi:MAG: hypothetical protein RLZZ312_1724 [Bacteroidota bacterium]